MARANLGRSRKKTMLVVASLSLAVVLLNLLTTFVAGFDMDKYLSQRSCVDFVVSTPDYFTYRGFTLTEEDILPVKENTEQSLGGFAYGTGLVQMYLPESYWRKEVEYYIRDQDVEELLSTARRDGDKIALDSQVEGLDASLLSKLKVLDGDVSPLAQPDRNAIAIEVSLDDFGNVVHPEDYPAVGERVRVTYGRNETAHDVYYEVCAWVEVPYNMSSRYYAMGYQTVLGVDTLRRDAGAENVLTMCYVFDTPDPEAEEAAESYLAALTQSDASPLKYESKATHRAHFREFQMTFVVLGGLLCAIIGIVGVLNFFNAMMTSILSRRREFAVLQAVGMTGPQLKTMLVWEGLLYTVGSGVMAGLLSAAVNPLAGRLLEQGYWFYRYHFTIIPVLVMIPVFALLGYAIPAVMYRHSARHSVVERLREAEV